MATKIQEARNAALTALLTYGLELNASGYNKKCIRDSIVCLALDVVTEELP